MSENTETKQDQQYGPHNFGGWQDCGGDALASQCACGAYHIAVGQTGSFHPAPNPLPDSNQCRLNPILNPIYGPHNFSIPVSEHQGTVTRARCQCGAEIYHDNKLGKFVIQPAPNPLDDHELCRLNPK